MNSKHVAYLLPEFVDGTISESERRLVEHHLEHCEQCRKELQSIQKLYSELEHQSEQKPPEHYWVTLLPRIHQRIEDRRMQHVSRWIPRFAFPLAFAAILMFVLVQIFSQRDKSVEQQLTHAAASHSETGIRAMFKEMSNEELQQLNEVSASENGLGMRYSYNSANPLKGDREILSTIITDSKLLPSYSDVDIASLTETLNDQEVEHLVAHLNQKRIIN